MASLHPLGSGSFPRDGADDEVNPTVIADLAFLVAWEQGEMPALNAFFRVRQIRRASVQQPPE